ncbi:hypothetical protein [Bacillus testis]|uniref:hypothetical protein n=1 Tax=Bacillus testis TaxID=1622072 RepID=UPI00067F484C|nr:hypothetical protein [Bacillus testis]
MLEFLELNDVSAYIMFAGMLVEATALIGLFYFLKVYVNNRSHFQPKLSFSKEEGHFHSQRQPNETNSIGLWIARCAGRKDSPDDGPAHHLLECTPIFKIQGGSQWKRNLDVLYLSLSRELLL